MDNFKNSTLKIVGRGSVKVLRHTTDGKAYLLTTDGEEDAMWCGFAAYDKETDTWNITDFRFITYLNKR